MNLQRPNTEAQPSLLFTVAWFVGKQRPMKRLYKVRIDILSRNPNVPERKNLWRNPRMYFGRNDYRFWMKFDISSTARGKPTNSARTITA